MAYRDPMPSVSTSDYERILVIVATAATGTADAPLSADALDLIRRLIPCDVVGLIDGMPWDRTGRRSWISGSVLPWTAEDRRILDAFRFQSSLGPTPATLRRPVRISDTMSQSRYRRTDLYQQVGRRHGVEYGMDYWLRGRVGRIRGITFDSSIRDFSDRDRDVLEVLGRHLATVFAGHDPRLPQTPTRRMLTPRQAEVFALVSDGQTNVRIGRALSISPLTVKKHVENAFGVMGVHSRAAAIASIGRPGQPRRTPVPAPDTAPGPGPRLGRRPPPRVPRA